MNGAKLICKCRFPAESECTAKFLIAIDMSLRFHLINIGWSKVWDMHIRSGMWEAEAIVEI